MKRILAFDCSSNELALYLRNGDDEYTEIRNIGLKHSERLLPLIDALLKEAGLTPGDLELIACAKGPGSFTGLRIAMATAKGIASATGAPVVSVLTPDYRIVGAPESLLSAVLIDAKKQRYYGRLFFRGKPISEPLDIAPEGWAALFASQSRRLSLETPVFITGPDAAQGAADIAAAAEASAAAVTLWVDPLYRSPRIDALAQLALKQYEQQGPDPENAGPLYIRRSEAEEAMNLTVSPQEKGGVIYQNEDAPALTTKRH